MARTWDLAINEPARRAGSFERSFAPGEVIFEEGDPGDVLFIIQAGEVELTRRGLSGRHVVANLGPGDFFGEMCVVLRERRTATATATANIFLTIAFAIHYLARSDK